MTDTLIEAVGDRQNPAPTYIKDPQLNLYRRVGFGGIAYSDGAEAERRIYDAVRGARDRSTFSPELARAIDDWPSEYHLSRQRHCVIRPLEIAPGASVLELGCGCGAITRYLGEIGAEVTAVEGTWLRARTAAERCHELPNVTVIVDDLLQFDSGETFDWVLLVGVLEYAPVFSQEPDPIGRLLRAAASMLAPAGRLVVAIENRLGLKYFNGSAEDHVGVPFYGLQGLYGMCEPRTFGRAELGAHLENAGLPHVAFHYPFPDYKMPRVVLSEASLNDPDFDAAGTLSYAQTADGALHRRFDEALVARGAAENGLFGDLSNSFLVVAAKQPLPDSNVLAVAYAAQRGAEFAVQTRFLRGDGAIRIHKEHFFPQRECSSVLSDGSRLDNVVGQSIYIRGALAFQELSLARARHGDLAEIVAALTPWFGFLIGHTKGTGARLSDLAVPGCYLDVTPFNLVETPDGRVPIDMEWRVDRDIPLGWVVTRALLHCLCGTIGYERAPIPLVDVISALCAPHRLAVSVDEIGAWLDREYELQGVTSGRPAPRYDTAIKSLSLSSGAGSVAERRIAELEQRHQQVLQSRSWRCTAPLRAAGRLARTVLQRAAPSRSTVSPARIASPAPAPARPSRLRAGLGAADRFGLRGYGWALVAVAVALMAAHVAGMFVTRPPRLLMCIAAVAVAARAGGFGPGVFAAIVSVLAVSLSAPSFNHFVHTPAAMERVVVFLVCAIIGIIASVPRAQPLQDRATPRR